MSPAARMISGHAATRAADTQLCVRQEATTIQAQKTNMNRAVFLAYLASALSNLAEKRRVLACFFMRGCVDFGCWAAKCGKFFQNPTLLFLVKQRSRLSAQCVHALFDCPVLSPRSAATIPTSSSSACTAMHPASDLVPASPEYGSHQDCRRVLLKKRGPLKVTKAPWLVDQAISKSGPHVQNSHARYLEG